MTALHSEIDAIAPAMVRLMRLAELTPTDLRVIDETIGLRQRAPARAELLREGREVGPAKLLLSGWVARVRLLPDGRRQFLSMVLPGELIGMCRQARPLAGSSVVALTPVEWCPAPVAEPGSGLAEAYAISAARDEANLLAQITRLGRLTAAERICDLFLELHERLALSGLTDGNAFEMPLTQETLADALGLTSVHINRMVQALRRDGDLQWKSGVVTLSDPERLAAKIGRVVTEVSAAS